MYARPGVEIFDPAPLFRWLAPYYYVARERKAAYGSKYAIPPPIRRYVSVCGLFVMIETAASGRKGQLTATSSSTLWRDTRQVHDENTQTD